MNPNEANMIAVHNNKKNGDYYAYPSFSHFRINFNNKKNDEKKSFSFQIKASISFILMRRT